MKFRILFLSILLVFGFLVADSKFNLLFFHENLNLKSSINCSVKDDLKNLGSALDSNDSERISLAINKIEFGLNLAYGVETKFTNLGSKAISTKVSKLAKSIDRARKQFTEYGDLKNSEIKGKIAEIKESAKDAENSLSPFC